MIGEYDKKYSTTVYNAIYYYGIEEIIPEPKEGAKVIVFDVAISGGQLVGEMIRHLLRKKIFPVAVIVFVVDKNVNPDYKDPWLKFDRESDQLFYEDKCIKDITSFDKIPVYPLDSKTYDFGSSMPNKCEKCNSLDGEVICKLKPIHRW